ncbi:MAG: hypothetical protein ABSA47_09610 [Verrucomicrobiota bacterium]
MNIDTQKRAAPEDSKRADMVNRIHIPPMVDNPQLLVPLCVNDDSRSAQDSPAPDAIYVPFKNRVANVKGLLRELKHYPGPIYLLPSADNNLLALRKGLGRNIEILYAENRPLQTFYGGLRTSNHRHAIEHRETWDLPMKRNFVIQHALTRNHNRILLVDDDIRLIGNGCLSAGTQSLTRYAAAGCFVDRFVDTSVMGHLERIAGDPVYPFLSGSFLFLKPHDVRGFFPCIYNEDWLFMILHVLNRTICSLGSVGQLKFDPFRGSTRSIFQEFGDVLVDGLYSLVADEHYERRHSEELWAGILAQRRNFLRSLSRRLPQAKYQRIISTMLDVSSGITPEDCLDFIRAWEKDLISWKQYIGEFQ